MKDEHANHIKLGPPIDSEWKKHATVGYVETEKPIRPTKSDESIDEQETTPMDQKGKPYLFVESVVFIGERVDEDGNRTPYVRNTKIPHTLMAGDTMTVSLEIKEDDFKKDAKPD